jgi:maltose alpha-D-glucosyltransferase / alpha-amylase
MERYWYKEAIIYTLDVRSFKDGSGNGVGDFKGLLEKFDHLIELGVTCLWILPFYRSENKDGGYDVIDYFSIDPKVGQLDDFKRFMEKANKSDVKILIDLVVNHTSNQHEWFKEAVKDRNSKYRKYYIWLDEKPANHDEDVVFKNVEDSNWQYHEQAGAYYYHTFYSHQPDLNIANPEVQDEILKIIDFWMKLGVTGFRIDAVPHVMRDKGNDKFEGDPYKVLDKWQKAVMEHTPEAILIAEADVEPKDYRNFLGEGERIHGLLNFYINNYIFFALAVNDPQRLISAFKHIPALQQNEQYLTFLRNHDELDLERLKPEEQKLVFEKFAPDENMRVYGRGIRRRLPPMVYNNRQMIELAFSLLLSLPGTPVIRYGEEIGMGDDLRLKERNSVRTSMQWDDSENGGFSNAGVQDLLYPVISGGEYGFEHLNVAAQRQDPASLLSAVINMIHTRRRIPEFSYGNFESIDTGNPQVMCHLCRYEGGIAFALHNFSQEACRVQFKLKDLAGHEFYQLQQQCSFTLEGEEMETELPAYGYSWWRALQA